MAITADDIWLAADRLVAQGRGATLPAVRKEVGGGSYSTISEAMREWRRRQSERAKEATEPLPKFLASQFEALGQEIWRAALASANDRLQMERERFEKLQAASQAERDEIAELARQTSSELEEAQRRKGNLETELASCRKEMDMMRTVAAEVGAKLAAAEAHGREADRRVADLNSELQRVNEANAGLIGALAARPSPHASTKN